MCLTESDGQPWGRIRSLEEPDALIALVRICGGRRLTFGSSGPIPAPIERLKALTDHLEKTKALEGRTFEVSKYTVDALLKNRTEFMDKSPGPGAAAPPVPEGISAVTPSVEIPALLARPEQLAQTEQPAPEEAPAE